MLQTSCSVCGANIQFPEEWLGKRFHCPQCGNSPLIFSEAGLLMHSSATEESATPLPSLPRVDEPRPHGGVTLITALVPLVMVGLAWLLTWNVDDFLSVVWMTGLAIGFGGCLMGGLLSSYRLGGTAGSGFKGGVLAALLMLIVVTSVLMHADENWGPVIVMVFLVPGTAALALLAGLGGLLGVYLGRRLAGKTQPARPRTPPQFVNEN